MKIDAMQKRAAGEDHVVGVATFCYINTLYVAHMSYLGVSSHDTHSTSRCVNETESLHTADDCATTLMPNTATKLKMLINIPYSPKRSFNVSSRKHRIIIHDQNGVGVDEV